ncbi:MAG: type III-B CRISPR module RAMP protein Cmr6 [Desulfamplus sp.]|nr:type III-B CRISPR module RAMP protein Cmr6 [Desulfamplus sp.]
MIQAIRDDLKVFLPRIPRQRNRDNLSLLFDRFCPEISEPTDQEPVAKQGVIDQLLAGYTQTTLTLYAHAFKEWCRYLRDDPDIIFFTLQTSSPMGIGLGEQNVHEFGITLQLPWATPFIPCTAIKGMISSFAHNNGGENWHKGALAHRDNDLSPISGASALTLFGGINAQDEAFAGTVDFLNAWWVPNNKNPFIEDIINLHNRSYYMNSEKWPDGTDNPLPNSFVTIQPEESFLFALKGSDTLTDTAKELLKHAAEKQGFGAKTAVGYGHFHSKTLEDRCLEIPELDEIELAEVYQNHLDVEKLFQSSSRELSNAFLNAASNREYTSVLNELFTRYRPATLLWLDLEKLSDNINWNKIKSLYNRYENKLKQENLAQDLICKQKIYAFCSERAPDPMPKWLKNLVPDEHELSQLPGQSAEELLTGKDEDEIVKIINTWVLEQPTMEEFKAAINSSITLSDDAKELIIMEIKIP